MPAVGRVTALKAGPAGGMFDHDAPSGPSDSGGPVVTPDGRLLGVHAKSHAVWSLVYTRRWCTAVRLLPTQITDLIEGDRRPR